MPDSESSVNSETTLISLAMLKLKADVGRDYLDYLKPFVLQVLSEKNLDNITDTLVTQIIRDSHGLEIPSRTIQIVLRRLAKEGTLRRDNNLFYVNDEIDIDDWSVYKVDAARKITFIAQSLVQFSMGNIDRSITEDDAIDSFAAFLSKFSIPCLKTFLRGTALPDVEGKEDWKIILVSEFVKHIEQTSVEKFDAFMLLVQGHMLANALLCPDLKHATKNYERVTFYFDTPILLQVLGLVGKEKKAVIDELIGLIKKLNGKIAYFSHTASELRNTIEKSADFIDLKEGRGSIVFEARNAGTTRSDLILIAEKTEEILKEQGILVRDTPPYTPEWQIDENAFEHILLDEINYVNLRAKTNDVNSVRSIYVLRAGASPKSLEQCKAVFVTGNSSFAQAAQDYGKSFEESKEISTVITDFSLSNISWLKAPLGAPSLPQKEVLAFAYAALCPSRDFWNKVLTETERLEEAGTITARDHQLIRSSPKALSELVKLTLGDESVLSETSIRLTIERVTNEIKKEESGKLNEAERENLLLREINLKEKEKIDIISKNAYWRVERQAKRESYIATALLGCLLLSIGILGAIVTINKELSNYFIVIGAMCPLIVFLAGLVFDIKIFKFQAWYFQWRFPKKLEKEFSLLGIEYPQ